MLAADSGCEHAVVVDVQSMIVRSEPVPEISSEVTLRCADGSRRTVVRATGRVGDVEIAWSDDAVVEVGDEVIVSRNGKLNLALHQSEASYPASERAPASSQRSSTCSSGTFTLVELYSAAASSHSCRISIGTSVYYVDDGDSYRNPLCDAAMLIAYDDEDAEVCYTTVSGLRIVDSIRIGYLSSLPTWGMPTVTGVEVQATNLCEAYINPGSGSYQLVFTDDANSEGYAHCTTLMRAHLGEEGIGWNTTAGSLNGLSAY